MEYGRCPELLDASSARTMSDTDAAQNYEMLPQQDYVLQRSKKTRKRSAKRSHSRMYLRIDTFHDSMVDTWKSTISQRTSAYQSLPRRRE